MTTRKDRSPMRSVRTLAAAGWVLALLVPPAAWAQAPWEILVRSVEADGAVNYRAVVEIGVYENGRQVGTRTQRLLKAEGNRKRIEATGQPEGGGLIVSNGRFEWEYRPGARLVRQRELLPLSEIHRLQLQTLEAVRETLHPEYEGEATIAGRRCYVIAVKPPDGTRTRKRMWVDATHFTELKSVRYGPFGGIQATWTVKEVRFGVKVEDRWFEFVPPPNCTVFRIPVTQRVDLADAEARAGFTAVLPEWAPAGYAFLRGQAAVIQMGPRKVLWLQWSNGVDNYSLFESLPGPHRPRDYPGATVWEAQGRVFVLTGWLSPEDRRKIRESTQR